MKRPLLRVLPTHREIKLQVLCCLNSSVKGVLGFPRINEVRCWVWQLPQAHRIRLEECLLFCGQLGLNRQILSQRITKSPSALIVKRHSLSLSFPFCKMKLGRSGSVFWLSHFKGYVGTATQIFKWTPTEVEWIRSGEGEVNVVGVRHESRANVTLNARK